MQRRALVAILLSLSGCYFASDTHRVGLDGSVQIADSSMLGMDAIVAADSAPTVDAAPRCKADLECPLASPQCRDGACVPCSSPSACARFADTPVCGSAGSCVKCTTEQAQLCVGSTPACDATTNQCVQCVKNADCPSEMLAACSATHSCSACTADADCARFDKVCNTASGACVACRPATENVDCRSDKACAGTDCPGTACNPQTFSCGTRLRDSVATCNTCDADSECVADHRCVPMTFGPLTVGGEKFELGNYCLKQASTSCPRMYLRNVPKTSVNGVADTYCSVDEAKNSCAAVLAFSKTCTTDASCGAAGARCDIVNSSPNLCTYPCDILADCKSDFIACAGSPVSYCGGK